MENVELTEITGVFQRAREEVSKVIIGQQQAVDFALITIFTGHHALIEGVPGIAKTLLVRTLARVLGADYGRVQFTPDLMPSDITGTNIFNLQKHEFNLVKGPIFTSFLLADEINRAPAKTQSALLQAMQERTVTIDRETHRLPDDFTVFATQNPIEFEGTYPLPEAQKDRFMLRIKMETPGRDDELLLAQRMLDNVTSPEAVLQTESVVPVLTKGVIRSVSTALQRVVVRPELVSYIVDVVRATRSDPAILSGAGPRATQALILATRAHALLRERDFVTPDDIKALAEPVLEHRIILRPEFEIEGMTSRELTQRILQKVPVPR